VFRLEFFSFVHGNVSDWYKSCKIADADLHTNDFGAQQLTMTAGEHEAIAEWLSRPESYPHAPRRVELLETHISRVFLAGPLVYKLKKPVRFDFLDFSTAAAREQACREELRLNRRLAPQAYLDVVPITRTDGGEFQLGGDGQPLDWLVKMRRLPTDQTLESLHRRGELKPADIDRLARLLADFYQSLAPVRLSPEEYRQSYTDRVRGNRQELLAAGHHLPRQIVQRVHAFQLQLVLLRPDLLDERVRSGRIVDGHGDLRPEHICLVEPPLIFDCIEFNPAFRQIDVADELAFLAAECDVLGAPWVGPRLLAEYQRLTGDRPAAELLDFYKSYRACVRAKVAALRADQVEGQARKAAAADAQAHLQWADRYARPWARPLVIAVGGLAGTGKTTLGEAVADALGAELLRTDVVRKDLFGAGPHADRPGQGIYTTEARQRVYDELYRRGAALHAEGVSLILDGTFSTAAAMERARRLVAGPELIFLGVQCECRPEVAQQRIRHRQMEGHDASDAGPAVYDALRESWQPWPAEMPQVQVDTEQPLERQVQQVTRQLSESFGRQR
jgi:aminoglycoside phosphotransferase family enzyme/predicted kinase